jgi:hypothetical protein
MKLTKADRIDLSRGGVELLCKQSVYWIGIRKHSLPHQEWYEFGRIVKDDQKAWARYEQVSDRTFATREQAIDAAQYHFDFSYCTVDEQGCPIAPVPISVL